MIKLTKINLNAICTSIANTSTKIKINLFTITLFEKFPPTQTLWNHKNMDES